MKIDISRVNLLEKDIEDWLYANPEEIVARSTPVCFWLGRQYRLPSGIADLIGVTHDNLVVVVEIKNVAINKAAITQVCRYAADIQEILMMRDDYQHCRLDGEPIVWKVLVGPSIDDQTYGEARACGVAFMQFEANLEIDLNNIIWSKEHRTAIEGQMREISYRPEWERFGPHIDQVVDEMMKKEAEERYQEAYQDHVAKQAAQDEYDRLMDTIMAADVDDDKEDPF